MNKSIGYVLNNYFKKSSAFTIIELIVSIVIIGILASIAVVSYPGIKKQMIISQMNADLRTAATQLSRDFAKNGKYPDTKEESGDGKGLTATTGTTLSYQYNSTTNTYCISATNGSVIYHIDVNKKINSGACAGPFTFIKSYGGLTVDYARAIVESIDDGYIIVGYTDSSGAGNNDALISKFDSSGVLLWSKTWGNVGIDEAHAITKTSDGGYIMAGETASYGSGASDALIVKYDSSGNVIWSKTWGGSDLDEARAVIQTQDGGYAIAGTTISFGVEDKDIFIAKFDSLGNLSWNKTWGGNSYEYARSLLQTADGGYVISGYTNSYGAGSYDAVILKFNSLGSLVWNKTWGGVGFDNSRDVIKSIDGGFVMVGVTECFGSISKDAFIVKYDMSGNLLWSRIWSGDGLEDEARSVIQSSDGGYVVTGYTDSFGVGNNDVILIKYNSAGDHIWSKTWGGTSSDKAISIIQASDGGYLLAGGTYSYDVGSSDLVISKYTSDGNVYGCSSTMCQSVTPIIISPLVITLNPDAVVTTPVPSFSSPIPIVMSPNLTTTTVVSVQ